MIVEQIQLFQNKRRKTKFYEFLMELDDAITANVWSNIIQQESIYKVNQVFAMIYKEEQHQFMAWAIYEHCKNGTTFAAVKSGLSCIVAKSCRQRNQQPIERGQSEQTTGRGRESKSPGHGSGATAPGLQQQSGSGWAHGAAGRDDRSLVGSTDSSNTKLCGYTYWVVLEIIVLTFDFVEESKFQLQF